MSELIRQLRAAGDKEEGRPYSTMHKAADEIERLKMRLADKDRGLKLLRAENAKLRMAIDMALSAKQHEDVKAILRGQLNLNELVKDDAKV